MLNSFFDVEKAVARAAVFFHFTPLKIHSKIGGKPRQNRQTFPLHRSGEKDEKNFRKGLTKGEGFCYNNSRGKKGVFRPLSKIAKKDGFSAKREAK